MEENNERTKKPSPKKAIIIGLSCFFALSGFAFVYLSNNSHKEKAKNFLSDDDDTDDQIIQPPPKEKEEKIIKVRRVERPEPDFNTTVPRKTGKDLFLEDKACPFIGHVITIIDGNTFDADIDLGLQIHTNQRIHIDGIKVNGEKAKNQLGYIISNKDVCIKPAKKEKIGKIVASVFVLNGEQISPEVGQQMIDRGFAKEYHGERR